MDSPFNVYRREVQQMLDDLEAADDRITRLEAERDRLRAACEATKEFLDDAVAYGFARLEKGRVLGLIRAALGEDAAPAGERGSHGDA